MRECWLRPNRRILYLGMALPMSAAIAGAGLAVAVPAASQFSWVRWVGWGLVAVGGFTTSVLIYLTRLPRLAYEDGYLLAYLESTRPIRVPIDIVECFFLGQASTPLTSSPRSEMKTSAVIVRLAESARQWHQRRVKPALGRWCDGYITIYGTWCEPISGELLKRLNDRLVAAHRHVRTVDRGPRE